MKSTKKLLSITNLKKYFPIAKSSIFQKEQFYVRANEDISIDIYEGETFGLVGESGCGKSTLGRTILQLYDQTAGTTMYYGRNIADVAPSYVAKTLKHAKRNIEKYKREIARAKKIEDEVNSAGENATFFMLQKKNLALAESQTAFMNVVKILGGLCCLDDCTEGVNLLLKKYKIDVKLAKLNNKVATIANYIEYFSSTNKEGKLVSKSEKLKKFVDNQKAFIVKKLNEYLQKLNQNIAKCNDLKTIICDDIDNYKKQFLDNPEFCKYEEYLDDGIDLSRLKYSEMRILRKDIQIIFQDPYSSLNPRMTVGQIIEEGLVTHKFYRHGSAQMKEYILETMRSCGLQDYMLHRYSHQFSGGQRQRICIARALAVKPKFIVCDECVSALDVSIQSQIINLLQELKEKENLTYLFISHDLSVVRYISDRIGVMYLGNLVELGTAETIFKDPRHPYTIALLSSIPTTDPEDLKKDRILLEGNIPSPIKPPEGCKFHTRCYMACDKCRRVPPPYVEVEKGHFVACHFLDKKVDEDGNYLFDLPKMEKKNMRIQEIVENQDDLEKTENA